MSARIIAGQLLHDRVRWSFDIPTVNPASHVESAMNRGLQHEPTRRNMARTSVKLVTGARISMSSGVANKDWSNRLKDSRAHIFRCVFSGRSLVRCSSHSLNVSYSREHSEVEPIADGSESGTTHNKQTSRIRDKIAATKYHNDLDSTSRKVATETNDKGPVLNTSVVIACIGAFLFGYHSAVMNAPLEAIASDLGFGGDTTLKGLVVSIMIAGGVIGSVLAGPGSDKFGRKSALGLSALPMVMGPLISAFATGVPAMVIGRLITGVGVGASSALVPLYLTEAAPTRIRGSLNSVRRIFFVVGVLVALGFTPQAHDGWWRLLFSGSSVLAAIQALGCVTSLCEESPSWLLSKGRYRESRRALANLQNIQGRAAVDWQRKAWEASQATRLAAEEIQAMQFNPLKPADETAIIANKTQAAEPQGLDGILELFQGNNRKPIVIGLGLCFLQAFSGSNTVIYFASSVFNEMGLSSKYLLSLAVGLPNLAGAVASLYLTDNWGRRPLLLSSFAAMVVALLVLAISIAPLGLGEVEIPLYGYGSVAVGTLAALTCIPVYVFAFSAGAGPIPWLLYSELFPVSARARATALCTMCNYGANIIVGATFLDAVANFGIAGTYAVYAVICGVGYIFTDKLVIETKGLSLQEVEMIIAKDARTSEFKSLGDVSPIVEVNPNPTPARELPEALTVSEWAYEKASKEGVDTSATGDLSKNPDR